MAATRQQEAARRQYHFRGALLAAMVGDALGMPIEGMSRGMIRAAHGPVREMLPGHLGRGTTAAYEIIRKHVDFLEHDRETTPDISVLAELIKSGELLEAVESALEGGFE